MKTFNFLFFAFIVFSSSAFSQDTEFHRIHLTYDISLDVPSHWMIISQDNRKNIRAAGKAMIDNAGIESSAGQKETLLAINSTPSPAGAMIRVSVTSPPDTNKVILLLQRQKLSRQLVQVCTVHLVNLKLQAALKLLKCSLFASRNSKTIEFWLCHTFVPV